MNAVLQEEWSEEVYDCYSLFIEEYPRLESPERALLTATYKRALDDAGMLPRFLWNSWPAQIAILQHEADQITIPQEPGPEREAAEYLRHKALEKVIVARRRLRLSKKAHQWLESKSMKPWSCLWIREQCGMEDPIEIPNLLNQPFE